MSGEKKPNKLLPIAAGCIAGVVEATAVWPLEFIKTQLQLSGKGASSSVPYNGVISGLRYTVQTTGFFSLYRGLAPTLVGSVPKAGIRFGLNAAIKDSLRDKNGNLTISQNFFAGLAAGVAEALCIVAPVETVKTRCIELNKPFIEGLKHIIKSEGISGVYKGATATALKQGSNMALRFSFYNEYKKYFTREGNNLSPVQSLIGGMCSGCFSTLGNNPFDVVKTRMQGTQASQYSSTVDCLVQIVKNEGFRSLYAGVVPRLGRVVPGQGIIFCCYEMIQEKLATLAIFS